jgi:benzoate/toluate 1,2-dioxygenase alpha subunit
MISNDELRSLVREDYVHRRVYIDPAIFELEMQRLFGRSWLYMGHESQVPHIGDFFSTYLGPEPAVMARHTDGKVYVLYNRCGHRGAQVVNEQSGNSKRFRCCYHGWVYHTNGDLANIPLRDGYPPEFDWKDPRHGMVRLPRVETYRGFVFAKLCDEGPSLLEYLGDARLAIDEVVDRSPDGEVELVGGFHRYHYQGNWKLQTENLADQFHAPFAHESSTTPDGFQWSRRPGERGTRIKILTDEGTPVVETRGQWSFDWGHNAGGALSTDGAQGGEVFDRYRATMEAKHGKDRARQILTHQRHSAFFYPNFDLHILAQSVRVIRPLAVDKTKVAIFPIKLKGAPDELFRSTVRLLNLSHSASSLGQSDDLEAFERCQRALHTRGADWLVFLRGAGSEEVSDPERGGINGPLYSEIAMRAQHRAWLTYMVDWHYGEGAPLLATTSSQ